jgi:hypothetical protein
MSAAVAQREDAAYVTAYVPAGIRAEVAELARTNCRSVSGELRLALLRHLEASRKDDVEEGRHG